MKDQWIFYTNPMSRGQIVRWALHEVMGGDYEERLLDYGAPMRSAEFLKLNPMGKVPVLLHEKEGTEPIVVTEVAAICLYLAECFPEKGLKPAQPAHPIELANYLRWTFFAAGPLEQAITIHSQKWDEGLDENGRARLGFGTFDLTVKTLASWLEGHKYVCGPSFSMADVYVGSHVDFGLQFGTIPKEPIFEAYCERLRQRPAYREARAIDLEYIGVG